MLFLGIDGGGSKTTAVIFDAHGHFITGASGASINYYSVGLETARKNMKEIISVLGCDYFDAAVIGMSALSGRASESELSAFSQGIINAKHIIMDSDLYVAMKAMNVQGECAVVISGTGSMAVARDGNSNITYAGGWGYVLGDEGSGYAIGLAGIKAAIAAFEGYGDATALYDECLSFFGISNIYDIIDLYYTAENARKLTAQFAKNVCGAAENSDNVALSIINGEAQRLAVTALSLLSGRNASMPIGLWGGIFQNCNIFSSSFKRILRESGFDNVKLLSFTPEVGAIMTCFEELSLQISDITLENLKNTYSPNKCKVI